MPRRRSTSGSRRDPVARRPRRAAGAILPAEAVHEYGGGVVDLRVSLRGPEIHFVQNVSQGTAGQQGRWVTPA